ncbi:hypothetical protein H0H93_001701 [Arthromyces matolae]|nr:hypothetical protein H0H93_001701 [Arthromyces matolae]
MSADDIQHLQAVGKDAQVAKQQFILKDDQQKVWQHVSSLSRGRVDFVLDNCQAFLISLPKFVTNFVFILARCSWIRGNIQNLQFAYLLFTDLVFADFLVTYTPYVSAIYFHPKLIPWFVSDVTPSDFKQAISSLLDPSFFGSLAEASTPSSDHLTYMVTRWNKYIDEGIFNLSVPLDTPLGGDATAAEFWTSPWPYWNLEVQAPELFKTLTKSDLVIFKGDLKLTGDVRWPAWTSFETAVGPLAGSFPLLSLRTNKADVVVGVEKEVAERLDMGSEKWRVDGR